jgi:hypothetical protein
MPYARNTPEQIARIKKKRIERYNLRLQNPETREKLRAYHAAYRARMKDDPERFTTMRARRTQQQAMYRRRERGQDMLLIMQARRTPLALRTAAQSQILFKAWWDGLIPDCDYHGDTTFAPSPEMSAALRVECKTGFHGSKLAVEGS